MKELTGNSEFVESFMMDPRSLILSVQNMQQAVSTVTLNLASIKTEVTDLKRDISDIKSQMSELTKMLGDKNSFDPPKKRSKLLNPQVFDWNTVLKKIDSSKLGNFIYIWYDYDAQASYSQVKGKKTKICRKQFFS